MKKKIKIILSAGLAIAICLSFIACSKSTVETVTEKQSVFSTESASDTTASYNHTTEESTYENLTKEETSEEYYHTAISGAVITEDDGDGYIHTKKSANTVIMFLQVSKRFIQHSALIQKHSNTLTAAI